MTRANISESALKPGGAPRAAEWTVASDSPKCPGFLGTPVWSMKPTVEIKNANHFGPPFFNKTFCNTYAILWKGVMWGLEWIFPWLKSSSRVSGGEGASGWLKSDSQTDSLLSRSGERARWLIPRVYSLTYSTLPTVVSCLKIKFNLKECTFWKMRLNPIRAQHQGNSRQTEPDSV